MPDPAAGGNDAAQVIAASLTGVATIIGALVLWPTRRRRDRAAAAADVDPEDRPAILRERIRALETRADGADQRLDHHDEEIVLLRAQEITAEGFAPRPPRSPRRRSQ